MYFFIHNISCHFRKVFLVLRKTDESQVVIKQIPVDDLGKEERFSALNEVKVLAMLKHPNIIAYYDNFVEEKSLMIVMEYAPGGTLHDFIQERNGLLLDEDVRQAMNIKCGCGDHARGPNMGVALWRSC